MNKPFRGNAYRQWLQSQGPGGFHHLARMEDEQLSSRPVHPAQTGYLVYPTNLVYPAPPAQPIQFGQPAQPTQFVPPTRLSHPTQPTAFTGPLPFHRLALRSPYHRWWRPLVGVSVFLPVYFVVMTLLQVGLMWVLVGDEFRLKDFEIMLDAEPERKIMVVMIFLALGSAIPVLWLASVCARQNWSFMFSIIGRMRWDVLLLSLRRAWPVFAVVLVLMLTSMLMDEGPDVFSFSVDALFYLLLVFLLIPFQCAAEELIFRGFLPQVLGAWIKNPLVCYLLPAVLFVVAHDYGWVGKLDVFAFALSAAYLTYRTGGTEAGIALHSLNNVVLFAAAAFLDGDSFQGILSNESADGGFWESLPSVLFSVGMTVLSTWLVMRDKKIRAICDNVKQAGTPGAAGSLDHLPFQLSGSGLWNKETGGNRRPQDHGPN